MSTAMDLRLLEALDMWRVRQKQGWQLLIESAWREGERCRFCRRRTTRPTWEKVEHATTIPHIADQCGVSPIRLAQMVRAERAVDGTLPKPRRAKRRGSWRRRFADGRKAEAYAVKMSVAWLGRRKVAELKRLLWLRRAKQIRRERCR